MTSTALVLTGSRRAPLESVLDPTGSVAYALAQSGSWAIEAGPIPDARFRQTAIEMLEQALAGFDRNAAVKILADERVRVVEGVSQTAADAFVKRLGAQAASAKAIPLTALAKPSPWRGGLPLLGGVGGFAAGWLLLNLYVALGVGIALAVALAFMNQKRPATVLGTPPEPMPLPYETAQALGHITGALPALDATTGASVRTVGRLALRLLDRVSDPEDFVGIASGGVDGTLGRPALVLLNRLGDVAKGLSSGRPVNALGLRDAADRSTALMGLLDRVRDELVATPAASAGRVDELTRDLDAITAAVTALST
jgi:hypothetical protein